MKKLDKIPLPSGNKIKNAEGFLQRKHNELNAYESIEHLVIDGEDRLDKGTYSGLMHHVMVVRAELIKALWQAEIYIGISIIDELVFQAARKAPCQVYQEVFSFLASSPAGKPGFVLYPSLPHGRANTSM